MSDAARDDAIAPDVIPFPTETLGSEATEEFFVEIPASTEPRLMCCRFFCQKQVQLANPVYGQTRIDLSTGDAMLIGLKAAPASSLSAGGV